MGADFYPRLTASIHDHEECNRLVNEQTLVGLLIAGPGVLATLTFAPLVIALFYSARFGAAVAVLRWICLGATLQVITWPMGFIIVAKGNQTLFFLAELAWTIVALVMAYSCICTFGLNGAGIAFFASYAFHGFLIYPIVHRLSGFRWSRDTTLTGLFFFSLIACVFLGLYTLPTLMGLSLGALAFILSAAYSIRALLTLVPMDQIPHPVQNLLARVRMARSQTTT